MQRLVVGIVVGHGDRRQHLVGGGPDRHQAGVLADARERGLGGALDAGVDARPYRSAAMARITRERSHGGAVRVDDLDTRRRGARQSSFVEVLQPRPADLAAGVVGRTQLPQLVGGDRAHASHDMAGEVGRDRAARAAALKRRPGDGVDVVGSGLSLELGEARRRDLKDGIEEAGVGLGLGERLIGLSGRCPGGQQVAPDRLRVGDPAADHANRDESVRGHQRRTAGAEDRRPRRPVARDEQPVAGAQGGIDGGRAP